MKNWLIGIVTSFCVISLLLIAVCWCLGKPILSFKETLGIWILLKILRIELYPGSIKKTEVTNNG